MNYRKWKPPIYLYILIAGFVLYIAFFLSNAYIKGCSAKAYLSNLGNRFNHGDFKISFDYIFKDNLKYTLGISFVLEIFVLAFVLIDLSKDRTFMPGKEQGAAQWGDVFAFSKKYGDHNDTSKNRIYSENVRISMDGKRTRLNNNVLITGGSGAGKTMFSLTPNVYQANIVSPYPGNFVYTDPKGELLKNNGKYLKDKGYTIKVLNVVPGMLQESDCFDPFPYIRNQDDIIRIANVLKSATDVDGGGHSQDPFWDNAFIMFMQSLFLLVWLEGGKWTPDRSPRLASVLAHKNMNTVLDLIAMAEVTNNEQSPLDALFTELVSKTIKDRKNGGENHPAYKIYKKVIGGAEDTKRSIFITTNARMQVFDNNDVRRIFSKDELNLSSLGKDKDSEGRPLRTALFCVIPDNDTTYNAIISMVYTILFQELFFMADYKTKSGSLPVPVSFWLDEFANVKLPDQFPRLLSTMRSRNISSIIIIQNLSQIKELYEKGWQNIVSNCDTSVYLGGNDQETFEYISKNLGKKTISKKSHGETKGRQGSSSQNVDILGRELAMPEEVREMNNDYCVIFVKGQKPMFDHKYMTLIKPEFKYSSQLGNYVHSVEKTINEGSIRLATEAEIRRWRGNILNLSLSETTIPEPDFSYLDHLLEEDFSSSLKSDVEEIDITDMSVEEILALDSFDFPDEEYDEILEGMGNGLTDEQIKSYILLSDPKEMSRQRKLLQALKGREMMGIENYYRKAGES
ncbi:MAG: type IV secretory system conjugative DNA transfer family protein [Eubacterium sp.]|nr:type IV secretory system conjugative DNA transfer family protein [Eubacterium sp.]